MKPFGNNAVLIRKGGGLEQHSSLLSVYFLELGRQFMSFEKRGQLIEEELHIVQHRVLC